MMSRAMQRRYNEERKQLELPPPETFEQFLSRYTAQQQVQAVLDDQAAASQARKAAKQAATSAQLAPAQAALAREANLA